ncbi:hypothetical protein [Pseudarthrobacter cellobiosi]|uniref:hypothetical protein n=1 Tax=Pseudarthrobacter cellobiosi TaxID=2953654 RepID=UPI00208FBDBF|nr:hypothetical protein [Pseudarthrobacter sp. HLT1-5]MCO4257393.1 hypothetical protein [Pseudarthrobacter sp. HLT1-5]
MRYQEFRRHVWILWREARHRDPIPPEYRAWIVARTVGRVMEAQWALDAKAGKLTDAATELGLHLLYDYARHFDSTERLRFAFWWQHVMEHGFNGDNPLAHLHKKASVTV